MGIPTHPGAKDPNNYFHRVDHIALFLSNPSLFHLIQCIVRESSIDLNSIWFH
jgi:hypothetical protein